MTAKQSIKTVLKYLFRVLAGIVLFVYIIVALINTTVVQSFLASKASDYFSKQWNTKVSIGAISVTPFINAGIKDIYVEDLDKDTLLYAGYIEANLAKIPSSEGVKVKNVEIKNTTVKLTEKNKQFNFQFIIDYFSSPEKKEKKESKPFNLSVKNVKLSNVDFSLIDYDKDYPVIEGLFASNRIVCRDIDLKVRNFEMSGINMQAEILNLSTKERCGIALNEFKGKVKFSDKGIILNDGQISTDDSFLKCDISMQTANFRTYSSFIDSVLCNLKIYKGSVVNLKDACYWSERVRNANQKVYLNCDVSGTVADMNIKQMDLTTSNTVINFNGTVKGLTDIENTVFDIVFNNITSSALDYNNMHLGTLIQDLTLPDIVGNCGIVSLTGKFKGKLNDFVSDIGIATDLGTADIHAKAESYGNNPVRYTAQIISPNLNIGVLTGNSMLGSTALDAYAEIKGTNTATMQGSLQAKMNGFYFNGSHYDAVSLQGGINGYDIDGILNIDDGNLGLNASVNMNYADKLDFKVDADMVKVDLHKMKLMDFADTSTLITAKLNADIKDFDIDSLNGYVNLSDIKIETSDKTITLNGLDLKLVTNTFNNFISLSSDILDADISGKYTLNSIAEDFSYIVSEYIPDFSPMLSAESKTAETKTVKDTATSDYTPKSDIVFSSKIKNIDLIRYLFNTELYIDGNIALNGLVNSENPLVCRVNIPALQYNTMLMRQTDIDILADKQKILNLGLNTDKFLLTDSMSFKDIAVKLTADSSDLNLYAKLQNVEDSNTNAVLNFKSVIGENGLQGSFENTFFNIQGTRIDLNDNHLVNVYDGQVSLMNFDLKSLQSKITLDGVISDKGEINCKFQDVDISLLNPFLASSGMTLSGKLNNEVTLADVLGNWRFKSNLEAENLIVNEVYLGRAWFNVDNNLVQDVFNTDIKFLYQTDNKDIIPLQVKGTITPSQEDDQLDLTLHMQDFSLAVIKTFIEEYISDVEGTLSCDNITVKGKISSPDIQGVLHADKVAMRINMLNTKYWVTDDIYIDNNKVSFKDFTLKDAENNRITINGDISHHNFSGFDMNLHALADKIKILDTKSNSGEMYYGTAYASANMTIKGDSSKLDISGSATTEAGTNLTVPITGKETALENDFIRFVNLNDTSGNLIVSDSKNTSANPMGYNISLDLNVNPNAKLFMAMDFNQMKGDLAASGNGDLRIEMNSDGKFSMVGAIAIDNGNFRFNIMDVMDKNFILQKGGTLTWNGDPTSGVLDVTAIYKTKTSLASILGQEYTKPVDVESIIRLNGVMTNPQPSFDINLPNTDEQTVEQLFMTIDKSNEKVMLEQTASILLTNQFYYSQGGYETEALQSGVTSSVMGVAFSQLSGMLTNMVKFVDVSLNYTGGSEKQQLSDQLDVNLSKTFGRLELEVNSSFGGNTTTYTTSQSSNIIGDMSARYRLTNNLQVEAFNHSNANDFTKYNISPYTQGGKITYKKEYNSVRDIFRRKKKSTDTQELRK